MRTYSTNFGSIFHVIQGPTEKVWTKKKKTQRRKVLWTIWNNNEILRELRRLGRCEKLENVAKDFREKIMAWNIVKYVRSEFRLSFDIEKDRIRTQRELADILFYYLMKRQALSPPYRMVLRRIWDSFLGWKRIRISWYRLCLELLSDEVIFKQFYHRLDNNPAKLEHFICQYPDLVLRKDSRVMDHLVKYMPFKKMDFFLKNIRDHSDRRLLVATKWLMPLLKLYDGRAGDLHDFILNQFPVLHVDEQATNAMPPNPFIAKPNHKNSVQVLAEYANNYVRSAVSWVHGKLSKESPELHAVRNKYSQILDLIIYCYTSTHKIKVLHLLEVLASKLGHTVKSSWLLNQIQKNCYVLHNKPAVLVIYSTKDRPGAEEEAATIYNTLRLKRCRIMRKKNQTDAEIIELVKHAANKLDPTTDLPPSALVVILLAHGTNGAINDTNGQPLSLKSIEEAMCSKNLQMRPKILITQCCQEHLFSLKKYRKESETLSAHSPSHRHFCSVMSCVPGETSQRAVLIPKLAQRMENSRKDEKFTKIVTDAFKNMTEESQTPMITSTLTSAFCLGNIMGWKFLAY